MLTVSTAVKMIAYFLPSEFALKKYHENSEHENICFNHISSNLLLFLLHDVTSTPSDSLNAHRRIINHLNEFKKQTQRKMKFMTVIKILFCLHFIKSILSPTNISKLLLYPSLLLFSGVFSVKMVNFRD